MQLTTPECVSSRALVGVQGYVFRLLGERSFGQQRHAAAATLLRGGGSGGVGGCEDGGGEWRGGGEGGGGANFDASAE